MPTAGHLTVSGGSLFVTAGRRGALGSYEKRPVVLKSESLRGCLKYAVHNCGGNNLCLDLSP